MAAAASTSMAATAVFASRFPLSSTTKAAPARCSALPHLPSRLSATAFPSSLKFAVFKCSFYKCIWRNRVLIFREINIIPTKWWECLRYSSNNLRSKVRVTARLGVGSSTRILMEPKRSSLLQVKASSSEESGAIDTSELLTDLKEKWDALDNKSTVIVYGGGAIVAVWLSSIVVGAINSVPLLPKIMELVGLGYTGWFVYRYLLFKSSRKELAEDIEQLKKKIAGTE